MPQMAPMNWVSLYLIFTMIFMIFVILTYFTFLYTPQFTKQPKEKKITSWKW